MREPDAPDIIVLGSVNLDFVARVAQLPMPGETVTGASFRQFPGGKGANQALAAKRLGANVSLVACVGNDANAGHALSLLREGGVDLTHCVSDATEATGVALICVDDHGENHIIVAPGANRCLAADVMTLPDANAILCQLEVPVATLLHAARVFTGFFAINLAPARDVPDELIRRADLIVVNETEALYYGSLLEQCEAIVVTTLGAQGAVAVRGKKLLCRATVPQVQVVDTTGAGDTFTAALVVRLLSGHAIEDALRFACAAGTAATTKEGAQPSLPELSEVLAIL